MTGERISNLPLRFSERKLLLFMVDGFVINASLLVSLLMRTDQPYIKSEDLANSTGDHLIWFIILTGLWLIIGSIFDVYNLFLAANTFLSLRATLSASLIAMLIYTFIPFFTPPLPPSRIEALILPGLVVLGLGAWRTFYGTVLVHPNFQQRVLIIGAGWAGRALVDAVSESGVDTQPKVGKGYEILGFVDDDENKRNTQIQSVPVLGCGHDLVRLVQELNPDELIIAITNQEEMNSELFQAIMDCREMGIHVADMASHYERLTGRIPLQHAGRNLYIVLPMSQPSQLHLLLFFKRLIDIFSALIGCSMVLVVAPLVWVGNLVSARGPLFYSQQRVGKGGKPFSLIKFRSMVVDAEKPSGAVWAQQNDSRITPLGSFLRKTRLDELPQFWNVLKGEMSLVGPRPERPEFIGQLAQQIPFYRTRHAVLPGLTGWAQINYPYGASLEDALVKLQYDLYYIKHQNLLFDLEIVLKTIGVVLGFRGR